MTATLNDVTKKKPAEESAEQQAAQELRNAGIRIALRVMDDYANNAILGSGMYAAGIRATDFSVRDKGIAWLVGVEEEPLVSKSYNITSGMAARIGERARKLREEAGRITGAAAGI